jgi:hypothetical protein
MRSFLKGYQVRGIQTKIAHAASGQRNHGFGEHKSPAIYAFSYLKFHCMRLVAYSETLNASYVLLQTYNEIRAGCSTEFR